MSSVRLLAVLGGVAVAAVGILGFLPGATTHYGDLQFGHGSRAQLFGVFRVSILLNLVHLLIGAIGVATGRANTIAFASLGLWLLGVAAAGTWLSLDAADNWLHLVLAAVLLGLAFLVGGEDLADDLQRDLGGRLPTEV